MRIKMKLSNKEITVLKKDTNFNKNGTYKNKTCGKCSHSEFRFSCFYDLKKQCNCKMLKGMFDLTKENNCPHYKYNHMWGTRMYFAEVLGEDISTL